VFLPRGLRARAGGLAELAVEARNVRQLIAALEDRFPGLADDIDGKMAVAIDGDIVSDPMLEPLGPGSEVHFLPRIGGGR
jgi:molybdopterin synthase sulfur carrier subunit